VIVDGIGCLFRDERQAIQADLNEQIRQLKKEVEQRL